MGDLTAQQSGDDEIVDKIVRDKLPGWELAGVPNLPDSSRLADATAQLARLRYKNRRFRDASPRGQPVIRERIVIYNVRPKSNPDRTADDTQPEDRPLRMIMVAIDRGLIIAREI